jgi:hypothetical protein
MENISWPFVPPFPSMLAILESCLSAHVLRLSFSNSMKRGKESPLYPLLINFYIKTDGSLIWKETFDRSLSIFFSSKRNFHCVTFIKEKRTKESLLDFIEWRSLQSNSSESVCRSRVIDSHTFLLILRSPFHWQDWRPQQLQTVKQAETNRLTMIECYRKKRFTSSIPDWGQKVYLLKKRKLLLFPRNNSKQSH